MKKLFLFILSMMLPMTASAESVEIGGIYYNLTTEAKSAEVKSNPNGYTGSIVIPESVNYNNVTYTVSSISSYAFRDCSGLTSVAIPNSVTSIYVRTFSGCTSLTSVTIPNSVTSIGNYAFADCSGLTSITIGNGVTSIGVRAFSGCTGLTSIIVSSGNTVYDSRDNCNAIIEKATNTLIVGCQNTVIPSSVTSIGYDAFYHCTGLTSITIPNSVTSIVSEAFMAVSKRV